MMTRLLLAALLLLLLLPTPCRADWLSACGLSGVTLKLTDGSELTGYVRWNVIWHASEEHPSPATFSEALPERIPAWATIDVYTDSILREVLYPDSGMRVAIAPPRRIPRDSIAASVPCHGIHDGSVAITIPVVLPRTAELLRTRPLAQAGELAGGEYINWLSYLPDVTEEHLKLLCSPPFLWYIRGSRASESQGLICLQFLNE